MAKKKNGDAPEAPPADPAPAAPAAPPSSEPAALTKSQKAALIKGHEQEIARLSTPEPVEYPRVLYKGTKGSYEHRTVQNAAEREALGEGWAVSPADLED